MSLTLSFSNVYLKSTGNFVGPTEYQGPLGLYFDNHSQDLYYQQKNYEFAERKMAQEAIASCLKKGKVSMQELDLVIAGDLLNQNMTSHYVARDINTSFLGIYSACANIGLALIQGAVYLEKNLNHVLCFTSSHNATAERQFRYPLEYGVKRKETTTFTATGAAAFLLSQEPSKIRMTKATIGQVIDYGLSDPNDMGSAMAPAAYHTIVDHLKNTQTKFSDYDLVITGDLSSFGLSQLKKLTKEVNLHDCGLQLYDVKRQEVFQGGSGCACSALVLSSYLYTEMNQGKFKRILFCPTGALLSLTSINQKETIPCICHAIEFEVSE